MGDSVEEKKRRKNERARQRYADDPEVRKQSKARSRASKRKNKDAINARQRLRYETDPEYRARTRALGSKAQRKSNLKSKYGLSLEGYATMLSRQNGVCVICLREQVNKPLAVDHDHKTGMLRDLLCDACNRSLGGGPRRLGRPATSRRLCRLLAGMPRRGAQDRRAASDSRHHRAPRSPRQSLPNTKRRNHDTD